MNKVKQINDFTCFLACLESFFADNGRTITQQRIIDDFPAESHKGSPNEGEFDFTFSNIQKLQIKYGITIDSSTIPQPANFNDLQKGHFIGALNMANQNCHHMVRFIEYTDAGEKIKVMDPKIGDFDNWSRDTFHLYKCYAFLVANGGS